MLVNEARRRRIECVHVLFLADPARTSVYIEQTLRLLSWAHEINGDPRVCSYIRGAICDRNHGAIAEANLEMTSHPRGPGGVMNAPSINKLIVLRRCDEGVTSVEALFFLGPRRNVSVDRPLAKNSSLAHCVKTVIEWCQKIRILNILPTAGSWVAFHVGWGDLDYQGAPTARTAREPRRSFARGVQTEKLDS